MVCPFKDCARHCSMMISVLHDVTQEKDSDDYSFSLSLSIPLSFSSIFAEAKQLDQYAHK